MSAIKPANFIMQQLKQKFSRAMVRIMATHIKVMLMLAMSLACTGCYLLNGHIDSYAEFEKLRNERIGEEADPVLLKLRQEEKYQDGVGDSYAIVDYLGVKAYIYKDPGIDKSPEVLLRTFRGCKYDEYIAVDTGIILGWRYVDGFEPLKCQGGGYKSGPW